VLELIPASVAPAERAATERSILLVGRFLC